MATKKNIIVTSLLAISGIIVIGVLDAKNILTCVQYTEYGNAIKYCEDAVFTLFPLVSILPLSLITYWMKEEIFRVWWNFARWMVPIIILATIAIQFVPKNGGFFNMDSLIYLMVLAPLYTILILVSLWKIFRKYRELKHAK